MDDLRGVIGVVGVFALPGSPLYAGDEKVVFEQALSDVEAYRRAGVDGILLENSHDLPYVKPPLDLRGLALMERIAGEARKRFEGPVGIQLLEAANASALEIAVRCGLNFLRVEGYVFAHVGGAGLIEGCAGSLLRRRKELGGEAIRVFADIKKKHCAHALTADLSIADVARQADFFLADGMIVTGSRTGSAPQLGELQLVREVTARPVWIGSGMTPENIGRFRAAADAFIVGTTFREQGRYLGKLEYGRLERFMDAFAQAVPKAT